MLNALRNVAVWAAALWGAELVSNWAISSALSWIKNAVTWVLAWTWIVGKIWTFAGKAAPFALGAYATCKWVQQFFKDLWETGWFIGFLKWWWNWIEKLALTYWIPMSIAVAWIAYAYWVPISSITTAALATLWLWVWMWMWWTKKIASAINNTVCKFWNLDIPSLPWKAVKWIWDWLKWTWKKLFKENPTPATAAT